MNFKFPINVARTNRDIFAYMIFKIPARPQLFTELDFYSYKIADCDTSVSLCNQVDLGRPLPMRFID